MSSIILSVLVVAAGVALGLARGGRLDAVMAVRPRWWGLVVGGFLLQALVESVELPQETSLWIIGTFVLVWAVLLGWALFDEPPDAYVILGAGIIIASVSFIAWREARLRRVTTPSHVATK